MQVLSAVDSGIATGRAKKLLTAVEQIPPSTSAAPLVALRRPQWLPQSVWPFQTSALEVDGSNIAITDVGQGPHLFRRAGDGSKRSPTHSECQPGKGFASTHRGHPESQP